MPIEWKVFQTNCTDYLPSVEDYATSILNTDGKRIVEDWFTHIIQLNKKPYSIFFGLFYSSLRIQFVNEYMT